MSIVISGSQANHKPKRYFWSYLYLIDENRHAYKVLKNKHWKTGDTVILPTLRVRYKKSRIFGKKYVFRFSREPTVYGGTYTVPKKKYHITKIGENAWRLKPSK